MIPVSRSDEPEILASKGKQWTEEYCRWRAGDSTVLKADRTRYRDTRIKATLCTDAHGKCVYCEAKPLGVEYAAIDHILPKEDFPHLVVAWDNLAFSCTKCNHKKARYFDLVCPLLNPYSDDPKEHFVFSLTFVFATTDRGRATVEVLKLNRSELVQRRGDLRPKLEILFALRDRLSADAFRAAIDSYLGDDVEFAACLRSEIERFFAT